MVLSSAPLGNVDRVDGCWCELAATASRFICRRYSTIYVGSSTSLHSRTSIRKASCRYQHKHYQYIHFGEFHISRALPRGPPPALSHPAYLPAMECCGVPSADE